MNKINNSRNTYAIFNGHKVQINTTIICPECKTVKDEIMPLNACIFFYECGNCKILLTPLKDNCCIYCSYGSVKCPPSQINNK